MEVSLGQLSRMLDTDHYVLVVHDQTHCKFCSVLSSWKVYGQTDSNNFNTF